MIPLPESLWPFRCYSFKMLIERNLSRLKRSSTNRIGIFSSGKELNVLLVHYKQTEKKNDQSYFWNSSFHYNRLHNSLLISSMGLNGLAQTFTTLLLMPLGSVAL